MTTTDSRGTDTVDGAGPDTAATRTATPAGKSGQRAYDRRNRRYQRFTDPRLTRAGLPIASALAKVPLVIMSILVLGAGIAGVLTINTKTDELGLQVNRVLTDNADLALTIEALEEQVAEGDSTPRIAEEARKLGMVPAADPAIITVDKTGGYQMIGTPSAQPEPVAVTPPAPPTSQSGQAPTTAAAAPATGADSAPATQAAATAPTTQTATAPTTEATGR